MASLASSPSVGTHQVKCLFWKVGAGKEGSTAAVSASEILVAGGAQAGKVENKHLAVQALPVSQFGYG